MSLWTLCAQLALLVISRPIVISHITQLPGAMILEESMPDSVLAATLDVIDNPKTIATVAKLFGYHRQLGGIESECASNRIFAGSG